MKIDLSEKGGLRGDVIVREHPAGTIDRMNALIALGKKDEVNAIISAGKTVVDKKNLVMQSANCGMDLIIQRLCSTNTYSLNITYGEIGTGTTTPAITDTALTTPSARVPTAISQDSGFNQAILQFFFPDSTLPNTPLYEFGTFVDGSATIGTGQIFNHALFASGYTKAPGTDVTVQVTYSISQ